MDSFHPELSAGCCRRSSWRYENEQLVGRNQTCGKWECGLCGRQRYAWFVSNAEARIREVGATRFLTLTLHASWGNGEVAHRHIKESWKKLRKELDRRGLRQSFVWVVEGTKAGVPHMHVFTSLYLPQRVWSELWRQCSGGSYIVWVRALREQSEARYVAKYCVKEACRRRDLPRAEFFRIRQYGTSQDIKLPPYRSTGSGGDWWVEVAPVAELLRASRERRCTVPEDVPPGRGVRFDWYDERQSPWGGRIGGLNVASRRAEYTARLHRLVAERATARRPGTAQAALDFQDGAQ